jgi:hypothetical protein
MISICAWCERYLGSTDAEPVITHGICPSCTASQRQPDAPIILVSRHRAEMHAVLENLLQGDPAIRVVIDRRASDRRGTGSPPEPGPERRRGPDRRRRSADAVLI